MGAAVSSERAAERDGASRVHDKRVGRSCHVDATPRAARRGKRPLTAVVKAMQGIDSIAEKTGGNSGTRRFFPASPRLSDRIYKMCTILSTGFVDNAVRAPRAIGRKALPGAGFGRMPAPHYDAGP
jgi:protein gp37